MTTAEPINIEGVERLALQTFTEKAYLEYSMAVILDRALPHIGDGLKPVQRRIVYAMSELGLKASAKYKKSARTVGDVLGKFHPHGDTACYEAMVLMAQPFSYRYPLVDGQGNWGAADDPKSFAAMRYTESRLSAYAEVLLAELEQGTVDWVSNFDGTLEEPAVLPARLPNLLLNGVTGIAVGMATDIPPHNLREVALTCVALLDAPEAPVSSLCRYILGPDYPSTAEIITPRSELIKLYESGTGSIRMRAVYHRENGDIVVTGLPHQVSGAKVLEQIAAQMQAKKLPLVTDLRDESDHEDPTRLVIVPRSNRVDVEALMAHLFATTDLEKTYRVNMNVIGISGRPQVKGLKAMLTEWLIFRTETVRRRLTHRLERVSHRLHILDGLLIAFLNIDEVIAIIRTQDSPKDALMARFGLSSEQAEAILEIKLRHLARLEEMKIRAEQAELEKERKHLETVLGSEARLKSLIRKELLSDADTYGDPRRSPVVEREVAQAFSHAEILPVEPVTVVLSAKGWVRSAKGHDIDGVNLAYKPGDHFLAAAVGRSDQLTLFLDSTGRSFAVPAIELPSARGYGEPLSGRLTLAADAYFVSVLMGPSDEHLLLASSAGYGFVARLKDLFTKSTKGKAILAVPPGCRPLSPLVIPDPANDLLAAVTSEGRLLIFPLVSLPVMARGKGNQIIRISAKKAATGAEQLILVSVFSPDSQLTVHAGKRFFTLKPGNLADFTGERGRRGKRLPRGFQKVDRLEATPPAPAESTPELPFDLVP